MISADVRRPHHSARARSISSWWRCRPAAVDSTSRSAHAGWPERGGKRLPLPAACRYRDGVPSCAGRRSRRARSTGSNGRGARRTAIARAVQERAVGPVFDHLLGADVQRAGHHRRLHQAALTGPTAPAPRARTSNPNRACRPALGSHGPTAARRTVGEAGDPGHAGHLLHRHGEAGPVAPGPPRPNAGIRTITAAGRRAGRRPSRANPSPSPRAGVLHDDVALGDQPARQVPGLVGQSRVTLRLLVFVAWKYEDHSHHRGSVGGGGPSAGRRGARRRLDVDDVGTEHADRVRQERTGPERREVGDPHAVERQGRAALRRARGAGGGEAWSVRCPSAGAGRASPTPGSEDASGTAARLQPVGRRVGLEEAVLGEVVHRRDRRTVADLDGRHPQSAAARRSLPSAARRPMPGSPG